MKSALVGLALQAIAFAQLPVSLSVDAGANRHPISPDIYGINDYGDTGLASVARVGVRRWGGDATSRYNWQLDADNSGADYYFESYGFTTPNGFTLPDGSQFDQYVKKGLTTGTKRLGTIPVLDWLPKSRAGGCSYSVDKYGPQQKLDPTGACGNGIKLDGTKIVNDPNDVSYSVDQTFAQQWIQYVISRYGTAQRGGVQVWSLDNEPDWWFAVHMDIHPNPGSYDEILSRGQTYAAAIKAADPTALVTGPVAAGWFGYFYSATDFVNGWSTSPYKAYDNPVDRLAHGDVPLIEWYMQQMQKYEQQNGVRLLDYVDLHAYIAPDGIGFATTSTPEQDQLRLTSTRVFWDPNYAAPDGSTPDDGYPNGEPPYLIPRMLQWVQNDYPGTRTAITEYNWGMLNDITGAIAQADILGIFGREGLDLAAMWGPPNPNPPSGPPDPAVNAFKLYLNYDGYGSQFGETSVSAITSDPDRISIFGATRSDNTLTIAVLNKTTSDTTVPVSIANFVPAPTAQVWQYSAANLTGIQRVSDVAVSNGGLTGFFPARSLTLLVVPTDASVLPVLKPAVGGVASAASYDEHAIAPGEFIYIGGSNFGPAGLAGAQATPDGGYLTASLGSVRVLIDGVPAPMIYQTEAAIAAIVPYEAALSSTAAVQVEVEGVRSDPFLIPVTSAVPGVFSVDASGSGQGAILNQNLTVNGSANPASPGDIVVLYATGEGVTSPPGVDGRLALDIRPVPVQTCAVTIGGQPASVSYCGAAPYYASGLMQINVQVPTSAPAGNVPVVLSIGGISSSASVTVAVK